ncbi:MAG: restriction endonuclease [Candidatus Thorarchaeota archaeon]
MSIDYQTLNLEQLFLTAFEGMGFQFTHPALITDNPIADSRLSYVLTHQNSQNELIGVIIRDWKRNVGVGQVHKAEELLQACPKLTKIIIISCMGFSYSAKRLADQTTVISLISRGELISFLLNRFEFL